MSPHTFSSIFNQYPDLINRPYVEIRLVGNFGFSGYVLWTIELMNLFVLSVKKLDKCG